MPTEIQEPKEETTSDVTTLPSDVSIDALDAMLGAKQKETSKEETPKEEAPSEGEAASKKETPKEESTKEEAPKEEEEAPKEEASTTKEEGVKPKFDTTKRDYTGFDEQEIAALKKMSNESFELIRPRLIENKELKKKATEYESKLKEAQKRSIAPDPNAFVLDPQYQKSAAITQRLDIEMKFWREQYKKVRAGEDWEDIVQGPDGKLQKIERAADPDAEAEIMEHLALGSQLMQQHTQVQRNMEAGYRQHYTGLVSKIKEVEDKHFPQWTKMEDAMKNEHFATMHQALSMFNQQNSPVASMLCKMYAANMASLAEIERLKSLKPANTPEEKVKAIKKVAGPSSSDMQGSGALGEEKVSDALAEFNKILDNNS